jgi:hypothetical protein
LHKKPINDYTTQKRLLIMIFVEVSQVIVAIPIHRVNTQNVLPLVNMGWTPVNITVILRQALRVPKSPTNNKLRDNLCISIPKGMSIALISGEFLPCPNTY